DISSIMKGSGMAMIGMGESESGDRAIESVHEALSSPLLDIDISNAKGALINISGSSDLTLNEAEKIVQIVGDRLDPEANIIWGAQIDEELQNMIRTTIVVSGVKSQYTIEPKNDEFEEIEFDEDFEGTALGKNDDAPADPLDEFLDGIF
ncbi:MAG: cell division protein FtsZ, partial [Methanobrevibacter sp.]|nr:cell division protein FtsZ [Methanobrevibacter sp.]